MKQLFARYLAILLLWSIAAPARVQPSRGFDMFSSQEEVKPDNRLPSRFASSFPFCRIPVRSLNMCSASALNWRRALQARNGPTASTL